MSGLAYLDTSAFIKLPLAEHPHDALRDALRGFDGYVASALLLVEAGRVGLRYGVDARDAVGRALDGVSLLPIDDAVLRHAATLEPAGIRSLDAVHLATALSVGDDVSAFLTYDVRLAAAARARDLLVLAPGA